MHKTKVVLILGVPGAGKGTQSKIIARKTGMVHISTGDLCRDAIRQRTELGRQVAEHMNQGDLVPDDLMISVIEERLQEPDAVAKGVLLDGYPRTIRQAHALKNLESIDIDRVILIQASNNVCTERIMGRRMDPETGDSYSLTFPECACSDPLIAQKLVQRDNDKDVSIIDTRLKYFYMNLGQVLQYFRGRIFAVDGSNGVGRVNEDMMKALMEPIVATEDATEKKEYAFRKPRKYAPKPKEQQCAICMSEKAEFLVIPCGHKCGCEGCLSQIYGQSDKKCPVCRKIMTGFVKVFNSGVDDDEDEDENENENSGGMVEVDPAVELAERAERVENDGGWGLSDALANHGLMMSAFEKRISNSLQVDISPCDDVGDVGKNGVDVAVTIKPPNLSDLSHRVPVDICCVIDTSASMALDAIFQDPNDETRRISEGLTILDIVKHAVKTVMYTLTEQDRISIVSFNSRASIVVPLTEMTNDGRRLAINALEGLVPNNQTNIWAGLESGLNSLRSAGEVYVGPNVVVPRRKSVFLLTDGQPVLSPPLGEEMALRQYFETYPDLKCQLHTFGFGYSLHSDLLLNIATHGNGTFSFIPDAKIVGTCFVNAIANTCSTFSQNCRVHLIGKDGATVNGRVGGLIPWEEASWGKVVHLGPLYYGQNRDIVVSMNIPALHRVNEMHRMNEMYRMDDVSDKGKEEADSGSPPLKKMKEDEDGSGLEYLEVIVEYESVVNNASHKLVAHGSSRSMTQSSVVAYVRNHLVSTAYDVISKCSFGRGNEGVSLMKSLVGEITAYRSVNPDPRLGLMLDDAGGRMSKAISTVERFKRWGGHYLRAITRSHQLQLCTNFMDAGLQEYGGALFSKLKDEGGKIFLTLDLKRSGRNDNIARSVASRGSSRSSRSSGSSSSGSSSAPHRTAPARPPPSSTTYFAGKGGGCFDESCWVLVKGTGGSDEEKGWDKTRISDLKRGDMVLVATDKMQKIDRDGTMMKTRTTCYAEVRYVVRIDRGEGNNKVQDLVKFMDSGLMVTKKHPIRLNGQWELPVDLVDEAVIIAHPSTSKYVYNVVLDEVEVGMFVNNVECVTFGHFIKEVWHPFYGSSEVIKYVESVAGDDGFAMVDAETLKILAGDK